MRHRLQLILAAVALALGFGVAELAPAPTAAAASYMFTTGYWYNGDARMYCNTAPVYKPGGRACGSGYLSIKYPGSSSYCYRRNTNTIWQDDAGWQAWSYSGSLYYVC